MIYTVTLNPSIDYVMRIKNFQIGRTNRAAQCEYFAGGKGINVSRMLKNLGEDSVAVGFVAGSTGSLYQNLLEEYGLATDFTVLEKGQTRINVKLKSGEETELNAAGPEVSTEEQERFFEKMSALQNGDVLVLAGSAPSGFEKDCYAKIMERTAQNGVEVIVDATGEYLRRTLPFHPLLVKPNLAELEELFGVEIAGAKEAEKYAGELIALGAQNVIVSMGAFGAILVNREKQSFLVEAAKGQVVNSVGAGDSMIAGYLCGRLAGKTDGECLKLAVACGCASTFSCEFGTKEKVEELYSLLTLQ